MKKVSSVLFILLFAALPLSAEALSSARILELVNNERARAGLSRLSANSRLASAAQMKASDMAEREYFEHNAPDGTTPWDLLARAGYDWSWAGENLGMSTDLNNEEMIVNAWMKSSGHRAIILDSRYTETGVGIAVGEYQGRQTVFVSQHFGTPKAAPKPAEPAAQPIQPVAPIVVQSVIQTVVQPVVEAAQPAVQKVVERVVPRAEAKVGAKMAASEHATTTASIISASESKMIELPEESKLTRVSWFARLKIRLEWLLTGILARVYS